MKNISLVAFPLLFLIVGGVWYFSKQRGDYADSEIPNRNEHQAPSTQSDETQHNNNSLPIHAGSTTTNPDVSTEYSSWVSPPLDANLASMRETLINESNAGNQRATCRYVVDEEACSRYQDFVSSGGRMGPYSFVDSEQDIANLDRIMFGRPMEMMQKVCKGHIDTRKQVPSAQRLSILRLAREIDNGVVGVESAIALITSEISLDKRNLEIIESAANMGNVRALEILANVDMFEYEMFANDTDAGRASQRYYWRSLYSMALDKITSPRMPKPELKTKIDEYRKMVPTDTLTAIDSRITDSFGKFSIEPRVWKKRVLLPTALNESYCDAE